MNRAASALVGTETVLGILPLGTLNHFARDLGIPTRLDDAAKLIAERPQRRVDVAEMSGRIFINNSNLGIYPRIVSRRTVQQQRLARGKWLAFFWATVQALREERFLILPHPEVAAFLRHKATDPERWLAAMRRLQREVGST